MDFDIHLAKNCGENEAFFRLYRWQPHCISIGANQNIESINSAKAKLNNIDIVKRPTGGRAILHAEEITYSVIFPISNLPSLKSLYCEINKALRKGLILFDQNLNSVELEDEQPDLKSFYKNNLSEICFAVSAKSEIKYNGKKLVGSAQRKIGNIVLQHGSILCGDFHKRIIDYLYLTNEEFSLMKKQMNHKTTDLKTILNKEINYEILSDCLISGFKKHFNINFERGQKLIIKSQKEEEKILL